MELLLCTLHLTTSSCRYGTRDNDERLYRSYNIDRDNTPYYRETGTIFYSFIVLHEVSGGQTATYVTFVSMATKNVSRPVKSKI